MNTQTETPTHIDLNLSFDGFNFSEYYRHEKSILEPQIVALGYKLGHWYTEDGDSFGPLVRAIKLVKDHQTYIYSYG